MEKEIKLIAIDMDGTLLCDDKSCTKRNFEALKAAKEMGLEIVPATGRSTNGIPSIFYELDARYGIFCNGATCYDIKEEKVMVKDHFTLEEALSLIEIAKKYDCTYDVYASGFGYMERRFFDSFSEYTTDEGIRRLIASTRRCIDVPLEEFLPKHNFSIEKVNMFFKDYEVQRELARKEFLDTGITETVNSLYNNLEVVKKGCSKGKALKMLSGKLGIDISECMALGDGDNDTQMVKAAGVGVAMKNAMDCVKEVADYITDDNNHSGVGKAVEKFVLKK